MMPLLTAASGQQQPLSSLAVERLLTARSGRRGTSLTLVSSDQALLLRFSVETVVATYHSVRADSPASRDPRLL